MQKLIFTATFLFLFISVRLSAQYETEIVDKGYGVLAVGKKMSEIKTYLVKIDSTKLRDTISAQSLGGGYTSAWAIDLKKAKMEFYFRQKITSIEVYFTDEYNDQTGEPTGKQVVARFNIYFETPPDRNAEIDFQAQLAKYYGAGIETKTDSGDVMNWLWFADATMLQVSFGYSGGEQKDNIWVAEYYNPKA